MQLKNLIVHVALIGACAAAPSRQQKRNDADILDGVISNLTAVLDKLDTEIKASRENPPFPSLAPTN